MGAEKSIWCIEWNDDPFSGKVTHVPTGVVFFVARNGAIGVMPGNAMDAAKRTYGHDALEAMLGRLMFECSQLPEIQAACGDSAWAKDDPMAEALH